MHPRGKSHERRHERGHCNRNSWPEAGGFRKAAWRSAGRGGASLPAGLTAGNCRIELRPHPMLRAPMFGCPQCNRACYRLYEVAGQWTCRTCGRLDYSSRHCDRSIAGLARLLWLRRRIGAELRPFGSVPDRPSRRVRRFREIVAEIGDLEAKLVGYLGSINADLKRRIRSRKEKYQW